MNLKTTYSIPQSTFLQNIDDETLLMNSETKLFFELNQMGKSFWNTLEKHNLLEDVANELLKTFDVSKEQLTTDLLTFTHKLQEQKLINIQ